MSHPADGSPIPVDIICSVLNGAPYIGAFVQSLREQTHAAWRLWVRDDGSTDDTMAIVDAIASEDTRVHGLHRGGPRLGCASGFGWLLERAPADARYIMVGDADDVWLPGKIARTLDAMRAAEATNAGPVLVHTDLRVVDAELREIAPSLWAMAAIEPARTSVREIVARNVVTAPTVMMNAALRARIGATPSGLVSQDWWYACVAAITGRIIALPEATVLYRQHGANLVGAQASRQVPLDRLVPEALRALDTTEKFRRDLAVLSLQAAALADRFAPELTPEDLDFVRDVGRIREYGAVRRKLAAARLRSERSPWVLGALAAVIRA